MSDKKSAFGAVLTAVITPFTEGGAEIDWDAVEKLAAHLLTAHTDGVVVCGTTGEGPTVTRDEKLSLFKKWVEYARESGASVIANTGTNNTAESVELTNFALEIGVSGIMAVMPYYNKPNFDGQIAHFTAIADCGLPVLLYNVPSRTGAKILPEAVAELSNHPCVVAIKEAAGDAAMTDWYARNCADGFAVYSGDDPLTLDMVTRGAEGVVSVASHLCGGEIKRMISLAQSGDVAAAKAIHDKYTPLFDALFVTTNPIPVKTACAALGLCGGEFRLPMTRMRETEAEKLKDTLRNFGLH